MCITSIGSRLRSCHLLLTAALGALAFAGEASAENFRNARAKPEAPRDFSQVQSVTPVDAGIVGDILPALPGPIEVCGGGFEVGDVVTLVSTRAIARGGLQPGSVGRIVSGDGTSVLVEFSGFTGGHGGNGWSTIPPIPDAGVSRWWVECGQIAHWDGAPAAAAGGLVVGDFLSGPSDASSGTSYTAALAEMGVASNPMPNLAYLSSFDVVFINHQNNNSILSLGGSAAELNQWVLAGGVLVVHDRNVNQARLWVPGLSGTTWANGYPNQCDLGAEASQTVQGSFGVLTDASLDGGNWSLHGFLTSPAPAYALRALKFPNSLTSALAYPHGQGWVYYSTMPLDHYLAGNGISSMVTNGRIYAKNVAERMIARACTAGDCNENGICDSNELPGNDCNGNGVLDGCDLASGTALDCNGNGRPDSCDIAAGTSLDCNANGIPDSCDLQTGAALDCNANSRPDSCDIATGSSADVNSNGIPDGCEPDCNGNGLPDLYEVSAGITPDCNLNGLPDSCDIAGGVADCDSDGVPDSCELAIGLAADCNGNGTLDNCDIASGFAPDCNANAIPDSCDLASGTAFDCNGNAVPDSCDLSTGAAPDCNGNAIPDSCDLATGTPDCNGNSIPDSCDIASGADPDPEQDGIPNSCEPSASIRMPGPVEGGDTCGEIGDELVYDIFIDNPPVRVVAGQFSLSYDQSVVELIEVVGGEEPFTYIPLNWNNAASGTLLFVASVQEGGSGTLADSRIARVRFRVIGNDCDGSAQVAFNPAAAPVLIADAGGNAADVPLVNPAAIRIVTGAPVLTGVPSDLDVPADAGAGCLAFRTLEPPVATSSCGTATLEWSRTDGQALGAPWPCGTTVVTWTATDICGRVTTATTSVTVNPYHILRLSLAYAGSGYSGAMDRCIDLAIGGHAVKRVFTFNGGLAFESLQVPVANYSCATADDDLHSLISRASVSIQGTDYAVAFVGDAALRNGDLTDDNTIDVTDWGIAVVAIGSTASVDTDCTTAGFHIDFDGNGVVNSADGEFILSRFLSLGETSCSGGGAATGGRDSITVASLAELVGSAAVTADLNGDAIVDRGDIELWIAQNGQQ